jgi:PadR family transcriptional regulator, regulatory protein PadR
MGRHKNTSKETLKVLQTLVEQESSAHSYALSQLTGYKTGTLSPMLRRLETCGYLESHWNHATQGPPRREYQLTLEGFEWLKSRMNS